MDTLNRAWKYSDIDLHKITIASEGRTISSASFDGLDKELDILYHVFTKFRGLVLAGSDGKIKIMTFDKWVPRLPVHASGPLKDQIGALSTRDDLILAGSAKGEVGGWNYSGHKLFGFKLEELETNPYIQSVSLKENGFLIARDDGVYRYDLHLRQPVLLQIQPVSLEGLDWATHDTEGHVQWRVMTENTELNSYRPVFPRSASQHKTFMVSLQHTKKTIVVLDFESGEVIREHQVDKKFFDNIQFMWCSYTHLFLVTYGNSIYTMDFTRDLEDFQVDRSEIAECFGLDISSQR